MAQPALLSDVEIIKNLCQFKSEIHFEISGSKYSAKGIFQLITMMIPDGTSEISVTANGDDEDTAVETAVQILTSELLRLVPYLREFEATRPRTVIHTKAELQKWASTKRFVYVHSYEGRMSSRRISNLYHQFDEDNVQCEHLYAGELVQGQVLPALRLEELRENIERIAPDAVLIYRNVAFMSNPTAFMEMFEKLWKQHPETDFIFGPAPCVRGSFFDNQWVPGFIWEGLLFEQAVNYWNRRNFNLDVLFDYFQLYSGNGM